MNKSYVKCNFILSEKLHQFVFINTQLLSMHFLFFSFHLLSTVLLSSYTNTENGNEVQKFLRNEHPWKSKDELDSNPFETFIFWPFEICTTE